MNIDLGLKFGSNEIIVYRKGLGIVAKEPAFLAVEQINSKLKVKAVGKKAEKLYMSKVGNIDVLQPIVNSEIVDEKMATILLDSIIKDVVQDRFLFSKVNILVAVPCALNEQQISLIKRVLKNIGASKITFVQNSVCARENVNLPEDSHIMVVDIGKYITDISVLSGNNFQFGRMYFLGGADMDKSITTFIEDNHELIVADETSEKIKNEVASLYDRDMYKTEYIGMDDQNRFVKNQITASEVKVAIVNIYDKIFEYIKEILSSLPKEIYAEIYQNGIMFVGGASKISGLYEYAKKQLDIPIIMLDDPIDAVILGAGKLLSKNNGFLKINL